MTSNQPLLTSQLFDHLWPKENMFVILLLFLLAQRWRYGHDNTQAVDHRQVVVVVVRGEKKKDDREK